MELPDPVALAPDLQEVLAGVVDPHKRRGVRHGLVVLLIATVCAVAAGARSFVGSRSGSPTCRPRWPPATLGVDGRCPSESTIRRLLGRVDADRFDAVIGRFVQQLCATRPPTGRRRVLHGGRKDAAGLPTRRRSAQLPRR